MPGWSTRVVYQRLAKPVQTDDGPISTWVSQIVWSWTGPLGRVDNNQFINFPLSVAIPASDARRSLQFKALQSYSNGQVIHWIGPAAAEFPAPTVNITAAGGVIEDVAGAEAGPAPGRVPGAPTPTAATSGGGAMYEALAVAALVVGALGLLVGAVALVAVRRRATADR